jgi:hypothetical protein
MFNLCDCQCQPLNKSPARNSRTYLSYYFRAIVAFSQWVAISTQEEYLNSNWKATYSINPKQQDREICLNVSNQPTDLGREILALSCDRYSWLFRFRRK